MYEAHFGLKSRPFGSKAEGSAVFVGPQQAKFIASLQKGLSAPDAVVTVTGHAGAGKTTLVDRGLETLPTGRTAARIGRMHLTQDEVVELLMGGFGIKKTAGGSIRRYAAFRRILQQQSENSIPVAIVIEDAHKLGIDALAEVEALTAADTGDAASANIILMGHAGLHDLLSRPELGRLKQRVRQRLSVEAFSAAEVQGYLKHSLREAGGDYDAIFDANVADIVFGCSEGIPRVINSLCETALTTAMEENSVRVTAALMSQVAQDAFGYDTDSAEHAALVAAAPVVEPKADTDDEIGWEEPARPLAPAAEAIQPAVKAAAQKPEIGHDLVVESGCYPIPVQAEPAPIVEEPEATVAEAVPEAEECSDDTNEMQIPDLINDTQPELPELGPALTASKLDVPVLDPQTDESDIESTQTLAQPVGLSIDEAVNSGPAAAESEQDASEKGDEHFDLDAALSPDVESTNVMPGITPNLDAIASEKTEPTVVQQVIEPPPAPAPEPVAADVPAELDLPTLSNSMRVDVDKEVKRANDQIAAGENSESPKVSPAAAQAVEKPAPIAAESPLVAEKPAPAVTEPPPVAEKPASAVAKPPPIAEKPTPVVAEPPPVAEKPAPVVAEPPPVAEIPEPVAAEPTPVARKPAPAITDATMNAPAMREPISGDDSNNRQSDIDALEAALAAAKNGELATQSGDSPVNGAAADPQKDAAAPAVPEITLDQVIANQQTQLDKLDQFRDEIGNVNSLEDVSDVMAETLFGVEFEEIAAAAIANPPSIGTDTQSEPEPSPVSLSNDELPAAANDAEELQLETPEPVETVENEPEPDETIGNKPKLDEPPALNDSAALRIDLLNAMKTKAAAMSENIEMGSDDPANKVQPSKGPQPEPIERQINTSMTQTLEALNVTKAAEAIAASEDQKEEKKSGGLFARFRKSS